MPVMAFKLDNLISAQNPGKPDRSYRLQLPLLTIRIEVNMGTILMMSSAIATSSSVGAP